jgi:3-hydroxybutyryl-CoA dehydratase
MAKEFYEDVQVGEKAQSPGRTITETDIVMFAAFTGDWLPIHTDAEYAKGSIFGERIAHGLLVMTVGSALLLRLGDAMLLPKSTIALYEVERIRFVGPAKIAVKGEIKNQRDEVLVTFTMKGLVGRRAPEVPA